MTFTAEDALIKTIAQAESPEEKSSREMSSTDKSKELMAIAARLIALAEEEKERDYPSMKRILAEVLSYYGVSHASVMANRRHAPIVRIRHIFYYLARELTPKSYPQIGRFGCDRDHTTVLHGCRQIDKLLKDPTQEPPLRAAIQAIKERLAQ